MAIAKSDGFIYVLDTNAILTDANVLDTYGDKYIALPDTVLSEIDKIKLGRADADTRFNGREFSRMLFELSEGKSLINGVSLPQGGELHVLTFDVRQNMPEGLSSKSPDDRIVAQAIRLQKLEKSIGGQARTVLLVTSDLNMLLKAQSYGLAVLQHEDNMNASFSKKYIVKPFQKYKTPLTILTIALAIFLATIFSLTRLSSNQASPSTALTSLPSEYRNFVNENQATIVDALLLLQTQPNNTAALSTVGNAYFNLYQEKVTEDPAASVTFAERGTEYFSRKLEQQPQDIDSLAKLGILFFYTGDTDKAISTLTDALSIDSRDVPSNYYLAIIYLQGRRDLEQSKQLFENVIGFAGNREDLVQYVQSSKNYIKQIDNEQQRLGNPTQDGIEL
ncbi:MAG: PIN domain-containing protein [Coriobacteriia bacterium]|nr:PIN domain-containing protein [Coriobacteriia bacterium]